MKMCSYKFALLTWAGAAWSTTRERWCWQLMTEVKRLKRMLTEETKEKKSDRARRDKSGSDWLLDISSDFADAKLDLSRLNVK